MPPSNPRIVSRTIEANGLRFAVDEAGDGRDVALCLHGFPESRVAWRHQLPALAEAGWRAIAPDLRGYGQSDRPAGREAYHLKHLVADVAGLFDACDARRRLLIGHDWGGIIAWTFAMQQVRPLDGLVILNAPHPAVMRRVLRQSWAQRGRSWYVAFFQLPWLPETLLTARHAKRIETLLRRTAVDAGAFPDDVLKQYRDNACQPGAMTAMINYYRANLRTLTDPNAAAPIIDTPTLLLWGEQDTALGVELTEGCDAYVRDLTLERLPGVSHWVQHEASDDVNTRLLAWLERTHVRRIV
ncbi:MAG TPA: alpha/beta hydrolase [Tepidisphaeraceae bacterium]|jgi:pimeloyl-ACP methyl ester carboxylesterase